MKKFLIFIDAADDAAMFPVSTFAGATVAADSTIIVNFQSTLGPNATEDKRSFVTLTITANKELAVFKALATKISDLTGTSGFKDAQVDAAGFLTVCDDVSGVFAHPDILSCSITLD